VDCDTRRNPQQVLVVAGKVRQPLISVVALNCAEGEMLSLLHVDANAHHQGKGISRGYLKWGGTFLT
jgi:hypothetical protein